MVEPEAQVIGMNAKAWGLLVSSVSSANMLLITAMLPFRAPSSPLLSMSKTKFLDKPKHIMDRERPKSPTRRTGFRPSLSESRPHCRIKRDSIRKKNDSYIAIEH
jgi:hypothetical protein